MGIAIVTRSCRYCAHDARFAVQLVIGGDPVFVTEKDCIAAPLNGNGKCEPQRVVVAPKSRGAKKRR